MNNNFLLGMRITSAAFNGPNNFSSFWQSFMWSTREINISTITVVASTVSYSTNARGKSNKETFNGVRYSFTFILLQEG